MQPLQTADFYTQATKKYINNSFTKKLEQEFEIKPYHVRYKALYYTALAFTYLANLLSFSTGAVLVGFALATITHPIAAITITLSLAVILEVAKRKTVNEWAKGYFMFKNWGLMLLLVIGVLSCISIVGSYYGAGKAVQEFTPTLAKADAANTDEYKAINSNLEKLRTERNNLENQKNDKGQTYYTVLPSITAVTDQINALESELQVLRSDARADNKTKQEQHTNNTQVTSKTVAVISLGCELLYLLLVVWCKYYRFHSYRTLTALQETQVNVITVPTTTTENNNDNNENDNKSQKESQINVVVTKDEQQSGNSSDDATTTKIQALKRQRTAIKKKLNTNKGRLVKGVGNPQTLRRNIEQYTSEITSLTNQMNNLRNATQAVN